ncbi:MAG: AAA family ATPase, partial [Aeromonas sp.]
NTVVIMTSNLGSDLILEHHSEKDYDEMKGMLMEVLTRSFRPEFINRIDETVVFHPLGEDHIKSIARIQLKSLMGRLEAQGYEVEVSEALLDTLVQAGFDPVYGARPLKRAIQHQVENPLAQALLAGRIIPGKKLELGADSHGLTMIQ